MLNARHSRRTFASILAVTSALAVVGCAGTPASSHITFSTELPPATTVADSGTLGAGWIDAASISTPGTFLALGAGDRLGRQVRQNDFVIAMGLQPNTGNVRLADVPVTND